MSFNEVRIHPIDLLPDKAIGLQLPLVPDNSYIFGCNYVMYDQIKANIKNLLLTQKGERIMYPDYGCDLNKILFEINADIANTAELIIRNAIAKWLPVVNIEKMSVAIDDVNEHIINISLSFSLSYSRQVDTLVVEVKQNE